jgi:plastocyanin
MRRATQSVFALIALVLIAQGPRTAAAGQVITVHIFNFDFSENPQGGAIVDPTIHVGDTVHWVWDSGFHSTTSVAGIAESWDSGTNLPGFSFDHTFTHVGTFAYYCKIHGLDNGNGTAGGMSGTVAVVAAAVPEPSSLTLAGAAGLTLLGAAFRRRLRARRGA